MKTLKKKPHLFAVVLRNKFGPEIILETFEYSFYQAYITARWYAKQCYIKFGVKFDIIKIWNRGDSSSE